MTWEMLDVRAAMFGVFGAEDYSPNPLAIFRTEAEASRWIAWLTKEAPEDELIDVDLVILPLRRVDGVAWNDAIENAPEGQPCRECCEDGDASQRTCRSCGARWYGG